MRAPLVWLNLLLATVLGLLLTQRNLFIPPPTPEFVIIAAGPAEASEVVEVFRAAEDFRRDYQYRVQTIRSEATARGIALALKEAIELKPRGISMPGHEDESVLLPFVLEAQRRGIYVTFHSTPLPAAEKRFAQHGTGYAGTRSRQAGIQVAERAMRRFQFEPGMRAVVVGLDPAPAPNSRTAGCLEAIRARGETPEYLQYRAAASAAENSRFNEQIIGERPPDLVFWDAGNPEPVITALGESGINASDVDIVSFSPIIGIPLVERMYVKQQLLEHNTLGGYMSLVQLHLAAKYGIPGLHLPLY